ncbi:hypothetical protein K3165_06895 [Qipengyuania sp. 1XM1-15A]|uniref:hypothetical protein n=1 Tax=Qipengyuania xiamenensis TaxID=2867237 RepID=UPI001C8670E8|nr:hypothetical protein [Qipengyuania xiamenensis]MBX7532644.1 hypothetical protein [Qipengyuania xiamenensis]
MNNLDETELAMPIFEAAGYRFVAEEHRDALSRHLIAELKAMIADTVERERVRAKLADQIPIEDVDALWNAHDKFKKLVDGLQATSNPPPPTAVQQKWARKGLDDLG